MKLYLDDDSASPLLVELLRRAGHDVWRPADAGLIGQDDPTHLTCAIREARALLSCNHRDFRKLHNLILQAEGHHLGILIVRKDNDRKRDLTAHGIALALGNLLKSGLPLESSFHIVNHFR